MNDLGLRGLWGTAAGSRTSVLVCFEKKKFSKETKIVKQVKHLLEVTYMWKNPQVDSE